MGEFIQLKNSRLEVKIQYPGTGYRFTRFDWSGIVEQVTLDGEHTFCSCESKDGQAVPNGGVGLCGAVQWTDSRYHDSVGFRQEFPLLGVGRLVRLDTEAYNFTRTYGCRPFHREVTAEENRVRMVTYPYVCCGVAVEEEKILSIRDNSLNIFHRFSNVGGETVEFLEYNHNFLKFDGHDIDKSYVTHMPYPLTANVRRGEIILRPDSYRAGELDRESRDICFSLRPDPALGRHWMRVENEELGMSVLIEEDFIPDQFWGWITSDSFSPETNIRIRLEPGETAEYNRRYTFEARRQKKGT